MGGGDGGMRQWLGRQGIVDQKRFKYNKKFYV